MEDNLYFSMYITIIVIAVLALLLNFIVITASLLSKKKTKNDFFYAVIHLLFISTFHSLSFCLDWFNSKNSLIFDNTILCKAQSFFITFTTLTEGMAVAMILWACYNSSKEENEEEIDDGEEKRKKTVLKKLTFLTLTYFVPLFFSVLGFFFKIYDKATMYCWVTTDNSNWKPIAITIICVPYLIMVLLCSFFTWKIIHDICNTTQRETIKKIQISVSKKLLFFPCFEFISLLSIILNRLTQMIFNKGEIVGVVIVGVILRPLPGVAFPILFGISGGIFNDIYSRCCLKKDASLGEDEGSDSISLGDQ